MAQCGYRTGVITDTSRTNWQNASDRPIAWSAWYPTDDILTSDCRSGVFFDIGDVISEASLASTGTFPVVLMSHGTGGTAESLGWLARALAREGYVVIGANHHGNSGFEPYVAEGFLCWWERAIDLSILLSTVSESGFFADRLDLQRVSGVGFSLGGHTVLALAGARTSIETFETWRRNKAPTNAGPKEFPDAANKIPELLKTSQAFRSSWARHGEDFTDGRFSRVVALAPAPPVRAFTAPSLQQIEIPVTILTGGADTEAPSAHCADWIMQQNPNFQHYDLGEHVHHHTFLGMPADRDLVGWLEIFTDHETVNRSQVHEIAARVVIDALGQPDGNCSKQE